ncbi:predicted protein [Nematostella vectensis]|uniref:Uncharacterized protein n=4 Tax=Nematostella vectensis TaxID=45351 RepID=A7RGF1_NEMVE|nr:predicted protein [Nematostella vectensis]|eukprot:XP_001641480.1 predicted protein [Nematostella vectensis]
MAPETTVAPETTMAPESTLAPETTMAPETTVAPETTMAPETTVAAETTMAPETTVAPETTMAPETTVAAETTFSSKVPTTHELKDECLLGLAKCDRNAHCIDTPESYRCECNNGYEGDGVICTDINECQRKKSVDYRCNENALCTNTEGSYTCECLPGFVGDGEYCEESGIKGYVNITHINNDVAIGCGKKEMMIIVRREFFLGMSKDDVNLNEPSCKPQENGTHYIFKTSLTGCGTGMTKTKDAFVYKNVIRERPPSASDLITRLHDIEVPFRCFYTRQGATSAIALRPSRKVIRTNASDSGDFLLHMRVYKNYDYVDHYKEKEFPIGVQVNKRVYFEMRIDSQDNRLTVRADRCHATPDTNPNNRIQYDLIRDSCPTDRTVLFHDQEDKQVQRFSLKAFQFVNVPDPTFVYIHCSVVVCNVTDENSLCNKECSKFSRARHRRSAYSQPLHIDLLTTGPIIRPDSRTRAQTPSQANNLPAFLGLVVSMAVLALLAFLAMVSYLRRKQTRPDDIEELSDSSDEDDQINV